MFNLPLGFHFHPTDDEIITILRSKIAKNQLLGISDIVFDRDVFDKTPPWNFFNSVNSDATIGYFFTPLKRKSKTGKNVNRVVANSGTWKGETTGDLIYDPQTNVAIGTKKYFTFCQDPDKLGKRKRSADKDGFIWSIHEFIILGENPDFSLCQITKKPKDKSKEDQEDQEEVLLVQCQSFDVSNPYPSLSVSIVHPLDPPQFQNNNSTNTFLASSSGQIIDDYPPPLDYDGVSKADEFLDSIRYQPESDYADDQSLQNLIQENFSF